MGARCEARTVFELVTQIAGDKSCTKLSSLNPFHLEFEVFVNHCQVRFRSIERSETLASELDTAANQCCLSLLKMDEAEAR